MFEDSLAGIISAKKAGMKAVGIAQTYSETELVEAGADAILGDLVHLTPEWVNRALLRPRGLDGPTGPSDERMEERLPPPDASAPPPGILLSRDLIFTSKVTGTARMLGRRVLVAGNVALASAMIAQWQPRVVFVDLAAGDLVQAAALLAFQKLAAPATPFVAFGSHVDTAALAAARPRLRPGPSPEPLLGRASRVDRPLSGMKDGEVAGENDSHLGFGGTAAMARSQRATASRPGSGWPYARSPR